MLYSVKLNLNNTCVCVVYVCVCGDIIGNTYDNYIVEYFAYIVYICNRFWNQRKSNLHIKGILLYNLKMN